MHKWRSFFFLLFCVYNSSAGRIGVGHDLVVAQLPAAEISLVCRFSADDLSEKYNIRWQRGQKGGPLVLEKNSINNITCGEGFKEKVRLGDNCTLIIDNVTPELAGTYAVTIHTQSGEELSSNIKLVVLKEDSYIYSNAAILAAVTTITIKIPTAQVILPCNYSLGQKDESVTIEWRYGQSNGSLVLRYILGQISPGSKYNGRVGKGQGCSLIISNPQNRDVGAYAVSIRSSNIHLPAARATVYLETGVEDEYICINACTTTSLIVLVLGILMLALSGSGVFYVCTIPRYRGNRDSEQNSPPRCLNVKPSLMPYFSPTEENSESNTSSLLQSDNTKLTEGTCLSRENENSHINGQTSVKLGEEGAKKSRFRERNVGIRHRNNAIRDLPDVMDSGTAGRLQKDFNDDRPLLHYQPIREPAPMAETSPSINIGPVDSNEQRTRVVQHHHSDKIPQPSLQHSRLVDVDPKDSKDQFDQSCSVVQVSHSDGIPQPSLGHLPSPGVVDTDEAVEEPSRSIDDEESDQHSHASLGTSPPDNSAWNVRGSDMNSRSEDQENRTQVLGVTQAESGYAGSSVVLASDSSSEISQQPTISSREDKQFHPSLHAAVRNGDLQMCCRVIEMGCDVNQPYDGETALHRAVYIGDYSIAELVLESGGHINQLDKKGQTALHIAAVGGHKKITKLLLKAGVDKDLQTLDGCTALVCGAEEGHTDIVALLLKKGARDDLLCKDQDTCLMRAAGNGHTEVCQMLINAGDNINHQNQDGNTALHLAALGGHTQTAVLLLKAGAQSDIMNANGNTALHLSAIKGQTQTTEVLLEAGDQPNITNADGNTALHLAALGGHTQTAVLLLKAGAQSDIMDANGNTALHLSAIKGQIQTTEVLLEAGDQPNITNAAGLTTLMYAASGGQNAVIDLLLRKGARVNLQTKEDGDTALHSAAVEGRSKAADLLLKAGADPNHSNIKGETALHKAAMRGQTQVAVLLLKAGAKPNIMNTVGSTALHDAADCGQPEVANVLLKTGSQVNLTNRDGNTALHLASRKGNTEIADVLLKAGAKTNILNTEGETPLSLAIKFRKKYLTQLLWMRGISN